MRLLSFALGSDRVLLVAAVATSIFSGITGAGLMAFIGRRFTDTEPLSISILVWFAVLTVASIGSGLGAKWVLIRLVGRRALALQLRLARQVIATPLTRLEQVGGPRLFAVLTEDARAITEALLKIPVIVTAVALVVGCVAYLAWLSPLAIGVLVALAVPVVVVYRRLHARVRVLLERFFRLRDQRYRQYEAVTSGSKELQMQPDLRGRFVRDHLEVTGERFRQSHESVQVAHEAANAWSQSVYFIFVLALLVMIRWDAIDTSILGAYALIALYMRTAIVQLTAIIPSWTQANVALNRIDRLELAEPTPLPEATEPTEPGLNGRASGAESLTLTIDGLRYRYPAETEGEAEGQTDGDDGTSANSPETGGFALGPIDTELRSGEIVFITGGNGSGKTTLLKVLCSLYEPTGGSILIDGEPVTAEGRDRFRSKLSAVFADCYLFEELVGINPDRDDDANRYLQELHLADKVTTTDGRFSTTRLSTGERKRLALLAAFLSDRPIYAFDEWAANQDPSFKRVFYRSILPELKRRNKLVIVISHDDRYFDEADRILHLSEGVLVDSNATTAS